MRDISRYSLIDRLFVGIERSNFITQRLCDPRSLFNVTGELDLLLIQHALDGLMEVHRSFDLIRSGVILFASNAFENLVEVINHRTVFADPDADCLSVTHSQHSQLIDCKHSDRCHKKANEQNKSPANSAATNSSRWIISLIISQTITSSSMDSLRGFRAMIKGLQGFSPIAVLRRGGVESRYRDKSSSTDLEAFYIPISYGKGLKNETNLQENNLLKLQECSTLGGVAS